MVTLEPASPVVIWCQQPTDRDKAADVAAQKRRGEVLRKTQYPKQPVTICLPALKSSSYVNFDLMIQWEYTRCRFGLRLLWRKRKEDIGKNAQERVPSLWTPCFLFSIKLFGRVRSMAQKGRYRLQQQTLKKCALGRWYVSGNGNPSESWTGKVLRRPRWGWQPELNLPTVVAAPHLCRPS